MRVLIDLLRWGEGGTQTYARHVVPALMERMPDAVLLAEAAVARHILGSGATGARAIAAPGWVRNPYRRHWFQRHTLPAMLAERGVEVYFVPGEVSGLPRRAVPSIRIVKMLRNMLLLDLEELRRFPFAGDFATRVRLELLRREALASLASADRVIFTSEHSRDVLTGRVPIRDHRLVYHPAPAAGEAADRTQRTEAERMVLYVSPTDPYKRQIETIEGFLHYKRESGDERARLVLAGPVRGPYGRQTVRAAAAAGEAVRVLGPVPPSDLPRLMARAEVLLFASTCECCPNVLLEYLAAGRPIVCSDRAPMPEIAGDAAELYPPTSPVALAAALRRVIGDRARARVLSSASAARAMRFPATATVEGTVEALTSW
ncbi:MAG TPA: glycosyltransferase [Candidatus Sulfotelmatobacter sp.]|nr:glycosyltransferase [Candidatus Sulfotelmatobacter sp.]